jgi:hypothetical protein
MKKVKKQSFSGGALIVAMLLAIVGAVVYYVNSTTGYMVGTEMSMLPLILPAIVAVGCLIVRLIGNAVGSKMYGLLTFILALVMAYALKEFIIGREEVIFDMLNPVNHPKEQYTAVIMAVVGIVVYLISFLALVFATFGSSPVKVVKK